MALIAAVQHRLLSSFWLLTRLVQSNFRMCYCTIFLTSPQEVTVAVCRIFDCNHWHLMPLPHQVMAAMHCTAWGVVLDPLCLPVQPVSHSLSPSGRTTGMYTQYTLTTNPAFALTNVCSMSYFREILILLAPRQPRKEYRHNWDHVNYPRMRPANRDCSSHYVTTGPQNSIIHIAIYLTSCTAFLQLYVCGPGYDLVTPDCKALVVMSSKVKILHHHNQQISSLILMLTEYLQVLLIWHSVRGNVLWHNHTSHDCNVNRVHTCQLTHILHQCRACLVPLCSIGVVKRTVRMAGLHTRRCMWVLPVMCRHSGGTWHHRRHLNDDLCSAISMQN